MPDANDFIVRIVLGLTVAYDVLHALYADEPGSPDPASRLQEQLRGTNLLRGTTSRDEADTILTASRGVDARFTSRACDASMMDSAKHAYIVHDAPTGPVFHARSAARVTLFGGSTFVTAAGQVEEKYSLLIESDAALPDRGTSVLKNVESRTKDGYVEYFDGEDAIDHSKETMNANLRSLRELPKGERRRNGAVALALKRAGDWGMIQHCRKYGMVFVTTDRFSALYAAFRGVCVMFMKVDDVRMPPYDKKLRRDDHRQPPAQVHFVQYAFSLFATDAGRTSLRFYEDDDPAPNFYYEAEGPSLAGGGSNRTVMNAVLLMTTVVVMAMLA